MIDYLINEKFHFSLKDEYVSDNGYLRAVTLWNMVEMKTMGDYHNLDLKSDVLL